MNIDFANQDDAEQVIAISRKAFAGIWFTIGDIVRSSAKKSNLLVAKEKDTVIGYVRVTPTWDHINISEIAVVEEYQGKGIGTALIDEVLQYSKGLPLTVKTNVGVGFYEKMGFVTRGFIEHKKVGSINGMVRGKFSDRDFQNYLKTRAPKKTQPLKTLKPRRSLTEVFR